MTLPVAGWYDDPADAQLLRWWTGTEWSGARERRRTAPPVAPQVADVPAVEPEAPLPYGPASVTGVAAAPSSVSGPAGPPPVPPSPVDGPAAAPAVPVPAPFPTAAPSGFTQLRTGNPLALTGLLVGLVALVFNPLGGLGLLTIVFGIMGVVRANELKRRGAAVTGFSQAVVALVLAGLAFIRLFLN